MIRKFNIRLIAFFLLIAFSQKLGLRVWMHHWLHETKSVQNFQGASCTSTWKIKCDCAEDALMPLTSSPDFELSDPVRNLKGFVYTNYEPSFFSIIQLYPSLKGPPSKYNLS